MTLMEKILKNELMKEVPVMYVAKMIVALYEMGVVVYQDEEKENEVSNSIKELI